MSHCRIPYVPLPGVNVILGGEFVSQPPENLRKCSFFNFSIVLLSANKEPIQIESAHFLTFIEVTEVCTVHMYDECMCTVVHTYAKYICTCEFILHGTVCMCMKWSF